MVRYSHPLSPKRQDGVSMLTAMAGLAILGIIATGTYMASANRIFELTRQRAVGQVSDVNTSSLALVGQYFDSGLIDVDCKAGQKQFIPQPGSSAAPALMAQLFPGGGPAKSLVLKACNPKMTSPGQIASAGGLVAVNAVCPKVTTTVTVDSFSCTGNSLWAILLASTPYTDSKGTTTQRLKARVARHPAPPLPPDIPPGSGKHVARVGINVEDLPPPKWDRDFNDSVMCFGGDLLVSRQSGTVRVFSNSVQTLDVSDFSASSCKHTVTVTLIDPTGAKRVQKFVDGGNTGGTAKHLSFGLIAGTEIVWHMDSNKSPCVKGLTLSNTTNIIVRADFCNMCPDRRVSGDCSKMPGNIAAMGNL